MFEKEERLLAEMKHETEKESMMVPDEALDSAIRSGIRAGERRGKKRYRLRAASAVVIAAAAVLLLTLWGGGSTPGPSPQLAQGPYPPLTGFDIAGDITASTANRHGLIQPVNQSKSSGEYTVTVQGVLTGPQRLQVFYTIENHSGRKAMVLREELKQPGSDYKLSYGSSTGGGSFLETGMSTKQVNYYFDESTPIPESVTFAVAVAPYSTNTVYSRKSPDEEVMEMDLSLDLETMRRFTSTVPLNRVIEIQGQTMTLKEAVLSPSGITVKANISRENSMKVSGLFQPYIESSKEGSSAVQLGNPLTWMPGAQGDMTYFFESDALDQPDTLVLKAGGMQAVNQEEMQIVVDVKQKKVLSSPEDRIQFGDYTKSKDKYTLSLKYEERDFNHGAVSIDSLGFTDGKGKRHAFNEAEGSRTNAESTAGNGYRRTTLYLYLEPEDYPQPLTFDVSSFPGVIEQAIEVPIQ
ncbi:DUF4179 domain-containing protein [Paenibacillus lactis]|uniref:DUF4179 domain-containing protein n=1 Tax=Paenibacillus TaxID=44249 RepID=UPI00203F0828|nr:DUF4179 domain-containing protein [Paenibacillus lactis]MCM3494185.1 DUF4179 domain-containing protein [Paenibacillus lactis]